MGLVLDRKRVAPPPSGRYSLHSLTRSAGIEGLDLQDALGTPVERAVNLCMLHQPQGLDSVHCEHFRAQSSEIRAHRGLIPKSVCCFGAGVLIGGG